jgi:hypothetical protein
MYHIIDMKETEKMYKISDHIFKLKTDYHKKNCNLQNLMCEVQFTQRLTWLSKNTRSDDNSICVGKSIRRQRFKHHFYKIYSSDSDSVVEHTPTNLWIRF